MSFILGQATLGVDALGIPPGTTALDAIPLDPEMLWVDEHGWTPVRDRVRTSVTGKPIVTTATLQYGRPITIERCWLTRLTILQLRDLIDSGGWSGTLLLRTGQQFVVRWRIEDGALDSQAVPLYSDPTDDSLSICTLRFMEIPL